MRLAASALFAGMVALHTGAQEYPHGRIRHVEGGATLQRASEAASEEAFRNLPFFPGDRVWTDADGRVEFQFPDGSIVRLSERAKLDYVDHEEQGQGGRVVLRLWSGAAFVRARDGRAGLDFEVETPAGLVELRGSAVARIDAGYGETRLAVIEGRASLDNGRRRVDAEAGEETSARGGEDPRRPVRIAEADGDPFAAWVSARERQLDWADADARYLPEEVAPYASDLEGHGSWHFDVELGQVWRPRVGPGWRPYLDGRWVWSRYGWTWVPNEVWGWAPFHYGRWGHSLALGWYWMPARGWAPAWVSWSVGGDYVGWCPLGRGDRPLVVGDPRVLGHATPRGRAASPWTYARREDLSARDLPRRRVELDERQATGLRELERGAQVDRGLRVVEGERAAPRNVQVRPTPGDTIPELRADPQTTIPFPVARRRYASEDERREREGRQRSHVRYEQSAPASPSPQPEAEGRPRARDPEPFSWIERRRSRPAGGGQPAPEAESDRARERDRAIERAPERDLLRRFFAPISGGRSRGDEGERGREGEEARPRGRETPRGSPSPGVERSPGPPREEGGATARRKRDQER